MAERTLRKAHCEVAGASPWMPQMTEVLSMQSQIRAGLSSEKACSRPLQAPTASALKT
jgi:hypothetical protein